nr:reverse transcriptase domain-containing protein [Tanacetum cinerariifolium]
MESVHDTSGCRDSQRVKYIAGLFVGKALTWWNSEIHIQGREAAIGMPWEDFRTLTREEFCLSNEMQKLETKLWNHTMVGAGHAAYTDRFYKLARLVPHSVTPKGKRIERNGSIKKNHEKKVNEREPKVMPRNVNPANARNLVAKTCFECGSTDHIKLACLRLNQAERPEGNQQNQVVAVNEARVVETKETKLGATTLFDSGADYSFVSATFLTLLDIEPSDLGFSYEIDIASGQLV